MTDIVLVERITDKIYLLRDKKVLMDRDLAQLYGVETRVLIQGVKRNIERFPSDFTFRLAQDEFDSLRSQIVISKGKGGRRYGTKKGSDTMGMKHRVDKGIYVFYGSMNPQLATKTGFSDEDAMAIKDVLPKLFENDASSARPEGSMEVLKMVWWNHNCPHGQYSSAKVHRSFSVNSDGSLDSEKLDSLDGLKPEIIDGF